jgi:transposase InsO family protein
MGRALARRHAREPTGSRAHACSRQRHARTGAGHVRAFVPHGLRCGDVDAFITKYSASSRKLINGSGAEAIRLSPRSPNLNAFAERFVRSIKYECLNRMIFIGQASLRCAVAGYLGHYHGKRNHQGLDNGPLRVVPNSVRGVGMVRRKQGLGGLLNFYCRKAVRQALTK